MIGRVGPTGAPFVIGAADKGKPTGSGRLYLQIAPSPWGTDSAGSYKIKLTRG